MTIRKFVLCSAAALLIAAGPALADGGPGPSDAQIAHIAYTAGQLDVAAGQQALVPCPRGSAPAIRLWVNRDPVRHTATARDRSFNVDLPPGRSGRTVVRRIGASAFHCIYHPGRRGTLTVGK